MSIYRRATYYGWSIHHSRVNIKVIIARRCDGGFNLKKAIVRGDSIYQIAPKPKRVSKFMLMKQKKRRYK